MLKNIFFYLLNNISFKLDLQNQFLHEFFNNSLLWGRGEESVLWWQPLSTYFLSPYSFTLIYFPGNILAPLLLLLFKDRWWFLLQKTSFSIFCIFIFRRGGGDWETKYFFARVWGWVLLFWGLCLIYCMYYSQSSSIPMLFYYLAPLQYDTIVTSWCM